jgi:hypothetical protein
LRPDSFDSAVAAKMIQSYALRALGNHSAALQNYGVRLSDFGLRVQT